MLTVRPSSYSEAPPSIPGCCCCCAADVQRMVRQVCAGLNAALILHGPTGGGKTYTAFGTEGGDIEQAGAVTAA